MLKKIFLNSNWIVFRHGKYRCFHITFLICFLTVWPLVGCDVVTMPALFVELLELMKLNWGGDGF